jgi:hypothetical protein
MVVIRLWWEGGDISAGPMKEDCWKKKWHSFKTLPRKVL